MQNAMTWVNVGRDTKRQTILALAEQLTMKYPGWREDAVLCDPEVGYQNSFFQMMLKKLDKNYLD